MFIENKIRRNFSFWIPAKKNKIHGDFTKPKQTLKQVTFQQSLRLTLLIGQTCSLMPVNGIWSENAADVRGSIMVWDCVSSDARTKVVSINNTLTATRCIAEILQEQNLLYKGFTRKSWKCAYSFLSIIGQIFITVMCIIKLFSNEISLNQVTPVIFYSTTTITMIMFYQVAKNWPSLNQRITRTEELDPNYDKKLLYRCNITCLIVLLLAALEHILSLMSAFAGAMVCYPQYQLYEGFVRHFYPWVFDYHPYSVALGMLTQFLHFQSTFIWNFSDLFVIVMSYYLTSRLDQVNKKLLAAQGKYLPEIFWRTTREDYGRASQLVRRVDDVISGIIFISFANNLFFICLQLFNTLEDGIRGGTFCSTKEKGKSILGGYEAATYFLFSLVYLITRSVAVSLIASQVNSASNIPATVLYDVPSPVYCTEVQRFLDQVNGDTVALSGLQFFSVTRGLLLTVAGTIVTYELVMFQFTSSEPTSTTKALLMNATTTPITPKY